MSKSGDDVEYEYQTFYLKGDLTAQREVRPDVVLFMEKMGYWESWADITMTGVFMVFKRVKEKEG